MPYYRYLAVDDAGPYPLLTSEPLKHLPEGVDLRLLEVIEDYRAAYRAHKELEAALHQQGPQAVKAILETVPLIAPRPGAPHGRRAPTRPT